MSSSASSRLPAVGTSFSSLLAFEMAACTAAMNAGYTLSIFDSHKNRNLTLVCNGNGSRSHLRLRGEMRCTCCTYATKHGASFRVTRAVDQHSCALPATSSTAAKIARSKMRTRVLELQQPRRRGHWQDQEVDFGETTSKEEEEDGEGEENSEDETDEGSDSGDDITEDSDSILTSSQTGHSAAGSVKTGLTPKQRQAKRRQGVPTKRSLAQAITSLSQRSRLSFPSSSQLFPDVHTLLLHLHAWAEQNNICLNQTPSSPTRVLVYCKPHYALPRCSFELVITRSALGSWSCSITNHEHDESAHAKTIAQGLNRPVPAALLVNPSADSSSSSNRHPPSLPETFPNQGPSSSTAVAPALCLRADNIAQFDQQFRGSLFLEYLSSFFFAVSPFTGDVYLSLVSNALLDSGVGSADALSALLTLEDETLSQFVEEIKVRKGWGTGEAPVLVGLLNEAKNVFAAEKQY
ncbi:hypothetical protein JCM11251_002580 [Rhodosporidiobolus azoricus]